MGNTNNNECKSKLTKALPGVVVPTSKGIPSQRIYSLEDESTNYNIPNYESRNHQEMALVYPSLPIRTLVYRQVRGQWTDVYHEAGMPDRKWYAVVVRAISCNRVTRT
jgi:hypothetical protein